MENKKIRPIAWSIKTAEHEGESVEIRIYDDIGPEFLGGRSASGFAADLAELGSVDNINVRINSQGGDVFDANAIHNEIARHPAKVTVDIDGMALSAASVIAMAGDRIRMAKNAVFMMHNPWTIAMGDAEEFRDTANILDKVRDTIVSSYRDQTGKTKAAIKKLLDAETWLNADEAKAEGFVDEVVTRPAVAAAFDAAVCRNEPPGWAVAAMTGRMSEYIEEKSPAYPHRRLDARRRLMRLRNGI